MWVVAAGSAWRARRKASNLPFRGGFVAKGCQVLQMVAFVTEWPAGVLACTLRNRDRWKAARCGAWRRCSRGRHEQGWFLSRSGRVQPPSTPRPTRWHDSSGFPCPGLGAATHYGILQWLLARFRLANRHCDIAYAVAGHQTGAKWLPVGWIGRCAGKPMAKSARPVPDRLQFARGRRKAVPCARNLLPAALHVFSQPGLDQRLVGHVALVGLDPDSLEQVLGQAQGDRLRRWLQPGHAHAFRLAPVNVVAGIMLLPEGALFSFCPEFG